jgi:hypothetical protein
MLNIKNDVATSGMIRSSVDSWRRATESPFPGLSDAMKVGKLVVMTSWTGFYHHLEVPGCKHLGHFPLTALKNPRSTGFDGVVISFKYNEETTGLVTFGEFEAGELPPYLKRWYKSK